VAEPFGIKHLSSSRVLGRLPIHPEFIADSFGIHRHLYHQGKQWTAEGRKIAAKVHNEMLL
jgi:hypothetical protein